MDDEFKLETINKPLSLNVLANDSASNKSNLKIKITKPSQEGVLTVEKDGTVTYTPGQILSGLDYFTYIIQDENGDISDPANVTVGFQQPLPLRIRGKYTEVGAGNYLVSGDVEVGTFNNQIPFPFNPLITVKAGSLHYNKGSTKANGVVYASLNKGLAFPLFAGDFDIKVGQTETSAFKDLKQNSSELELAGLDIDFSKLRLEANSLALQGSIRLPDFLGGVSVAIDGTNALLIDQNGLSLSGGVLTLPGVGVRFGKLLDIQTSDLVLTYEHQPESLKINGTANISLPFFRGAKGSADFSGPQRYIRIVPNLTGPQGVQVDAVGDLSLENIVFVPEIWELKNASIHLNTVEVEKGITGSADLLLPLGIDVDASFAFKNSNNEWNLDEVAIKAKGEWIGKALPVFPFLSLKSISGAVTGISSGSLSVENVDVELAAGSIDIPKLPTWLGGPISGSLLAVRAKGIIDQDKLEANADLDLFALFGGLIKTANDPNIAVKLKLIWGQSLAFKAKVTIFKDLFSGGAGFEATSDGDITASVSGSLKIPKGIEFLPDFLEGFEIATAFGQLRYLNDSILSNDYIVVGGAITGVSRITDWLGIASGIRVYFNGDVDPIGLKQLQQLAKDFDQQQGLNKAEGSYPLFSTAVYAAIPGLNDSTLSGITEQSWELAKSALRNLAASPDFSLIYDTAFGSSWDRLSAISIQQSWLADDFSDLPNIEVVSASTISNANAAYSETTNAIYLSRDFLAGNQLDPAVISGVLLEKIGHWVDAQVSIADSPGDEGAIFSALVQGEALDDRQLQQLRTEDDTVIVNSGVLQPNLDPSQITEASYDVDPNTPWLLLSAKWENDVGQPDIKLQAPDGRVYTGADFSESNNIQIDPELSSSTQLVIGVKRPAAGEWNLKLLCNSDPGKVDFKALGGTNAPKVAIFSLTPDADGHKVTINYDASDIFSDAEISFYYDTDLNNFDGFLIANTVVTSNGSGVYVWDASGLAAGDYYVYVIAKGQDSVPVAGYASEKVRIGDATSNTPPALTGTPVILPEGREDIPYIFSTASLLQGFTDAEDDTLSVTNLSATNGTLVDNGNGTYTFTPEGQYKGPVNLTYTVVDGKGGSVAATQSFAIRPVNPEVPSVSPITVLARLTSRPASVNALYALSSAEGSLLSLDTIRNQSRLMFNTLENTNTPDLSAFRFERRFQIGNLKDMKFFELVDNDLSIVLDASPNLEAFQRAVRWLTPQERGEGRFSLRSESGLSVDLEIVPGGAGLQDQIANLQEQSPVLDFRGTSAGTQLEVIMAREAGLNSRINFYRILDAEGTVLDPITGALLRPDASGYADAALHANNRVGALADLNVANSQTLSFTARLEASALIAPVATVSDGNRYFAFAAANRDGIQHWKSLGTNMFGLEDLYGGGDRDFDDFVVAIGAGALA